MNHLLYIKNQRTIADAAKKEGWRPDKDTVVIGELATLLEAAACPYDCNTGPECDPKVEGVCQFCHKRSELLGDGK